MVVVTRFAPSPTGDLHIGGIRTALFNWLFAKSQGGKFLLRIEDTDENRSNDESLKSIIDGLSWMNLNWDEDIVHQSKNVDCHRNVVDELLARGAAYKCYLTESELQKIREENNLELLRKYRDNDCTLNLPYVVRFKMPLSGEIVMHDLVKGSITKQCDQLEDFVILRGNENPTYNLACVVDDYKMKITHIIRGDDHVTNSFKQIAIYNAMGWTLPKYAHIPLIHNAEDRKLSKRNADSGISYYKQKGILSDAMFNYLLRLGWSHGDDEIISVKEAIKYFNLNSVGKSSSRLDEKKLLYINGIYLRKTQSSDLLELIMQDVDLNEKSVKMVKDSINALKLRANTVNDLKEMALDFFADKLPKYTIEKPEISLNAVEFLKSWIPHYDENQFREELKEKKLQLKEVAPFIRFALSGRSISPGIFDMIRFLGSDLSKYRINYALISSF